VKDFTTDMDDMTPQHRELLELIGREGATSDQLGRREQTREFGDVRSAGLVNYWPPGQTRPLDVSPAYEEPGRWYLTHAGADVLGIVLPLLRFAS
jgi:hypothetical protein